MADGNVRCGCTPLNKQSHVVQTNEDGVERCGSLPAIERCKPVRDSPYHLNASESTICERNLRPGLNTRSERTMQQPIAILWSSYGGIDVRNCGREQNGWRCMSRPKFGPDRG